MFANLQQTLSPVGQTKDWSDGEFSYSHFYRGSGCLAVVHFSLRQRLRLGSIGTWPRLWRPSGIRRFPRDRRLFLRLFHGQPLSGEAASYS